MFYGQIVPESTVDILPSALSIRFGVTRFESSFLVQTSATYPLWYMLRVIAASHHTVGNTHTLGGSLWTTDRPAAETST